MIYEISKGSDPKGIRPRVPRTPAPPLTAGPTSPKTPRPFGWELGAMREGQGRDGSRAHVSWKTWGPTTLFSFTSADSGGSWVRCASCSSRGSRVAFTLARGPCSDCADTTTYRNPIHPNSPPPPPSPGSPWTSSGGSSALPSHRSPPPIYRPHRPKTSRRTLPLEAGAVGEGRPQEG